VLAVAFQNERPGSLFFTPAIKKSY
jgi:hypothetical protein